MQKTLHFDSACDFSEGMASVCRYGKWGFIDTSGKVIVPCKYDVVDAFHEGMARVNVGGRWERSVVDEELIISGGKTGFIDKTGLEVIPCQYFYADNFHDGLAQIEVREDGNSSFFFIDKNGHRAGPSIHSWSDVFSEGLAKTYNNSSKCGFMDKSGNVLIPCKYDDAGDFHEGFAWVKRYGKCGFIDKNGVEVVPFKYEWARDFNEGMAEVWIGGKWEYSEEVGQDVLSGCKIGFIDRSGREVIPCQYKLVSDFHDGLAIVNVKDKEYGFIDKTGQVVILGVSAGAEFSEGLACIQAYYTDYKYSDYIDKTGKVVIPGRFDRAYDFHDGLAKVKEGRVWGFIDKTGQMVLEYKKE